MPTTCPIEMRKGLQQGIRMSAGRSKNALSSSSHYGDQKGSADGGSVTKSMSRSTAPTSAGSRSA